MRASRVSLSFFYPLLRFCIPSRLGPLLLVAYLLVASAFHHETEGSMHRTDLVEAFFGGGGEFNALLYYGRRRFVRLLVPQLLALRRPTDTTDTTSALAIREGKVLDRVFVAVNTKDAEDLKYLNEFVDDSFFIRIEIEPHALARGTWGWCAALEMHLELHANRTKGTVLTSKIDDDVIWVHPAALLTLLHFKLSHRHALLVSANVINHRELTAVHLRTGVLAGQPAYERRAPALDRLGYHTGETLFHEAAEVAHAVLLPFLRNGSSTVLHRYNTFHSWDFNVGDRYDKTFAINLVVYDPTDIPYEYKQCIKGGDEAYLSQLLPQRFNRHCVAVGAAVALHFAYEFQRFANVSAGHSTLAAYADILLPKA